MLWVAHDFFRPPYNVQSRMILVSENKCSFCCLPTKGVLLKHPRMRSKNCAQRPRRGATSRNEQLAARTTVRKNKNKMLLVQDWVQCFGVDVSVTSAEVKLPKNGRVKAFFGHVRLSRHSLLSVAEAQV